MNVVRAQNDLKRLFSIMLVLQLVTLIFSIGIILILLSSKRITPFTQSVELLSPTNPSGTASPVLNKSLNRLSFERLLYKEKTLTNIFEIPTEVGMFVIASSGVPRPKPVNFHLSGVSALTKGAIVSKFLGYLYSWRGSGVIECDYCLPPGYSRRSFHFDQLLKESRKVLKYAQEASDENQDVEEQQWQPPLFSFEPESLVEALVQFNNSRPSPEGRPVEISLIGTQGVDIRHNLMMTAPSSEGILVSLKQADEALRKGRNTLNREENERC